MLKIYGFQKMTLLDFPGHVAATVFTGGCNLRCPFCHNAALVTEIDEAAIYNEDDILAFLAKRTNLLDGVAITGGEPLMQPDICDFINKVREMGYKVKLDTNGTYPDKLAEIVDNHLVEYIAVDIKNSRKKYNETAGVENFPLKNLDRSLEILKNCDIEHEFRTTVVKELHEIGDIIKIGKWLAPEKNYFLQNFVDSGNLIGSGFSAVSRETLEEMRKAATPFFENVGVRGV